MLFIKVKEEESLSELITCYHGYHINSTDIVVLFNTENIEFFNQHYCMSESMQNVYTVLN